MSHIAKFSLSLEDERRLRVCLEALGCTLTEGSFNIPASWRRYNTGAGNTIDAQGNVTKWQGQDVVFGFSMRQQRAGQPTGTELTNYGFTRAADGSLCLVGDDYTLGLGETFIQNAIENSYANEGVNEVVPVLEALGYVEQPADNTVQLQMLA